MHRPRQSRGGFDLTCRVAQRALEPALPSLMEVTFMPGGIGAVAYAHMNSNRIDDPNVIVALSSGSALNIAQGKFGADFDENDARWLASAGADFGAVIVRDDSPYQTLGELMEAAKADPSGIVLGAGGSIGSQDWMKAALLMRSIGVDPRNLRYVAYEGGGASKAALLGGQIQVYTGDVSEMAGELGAGTMRILAVLSEERLPEPFAEFPTAPRGRLRRRLDDLPRLLHGPGRVGRGLRLVGRALRGGLCPIPLRRDPPASRACCEVQPCRRGIRRLREERSTSFRELAREAGLIQ